MAIPSPVFPRMETDFLMISGISKPRLQPWEDGGGEEDQEDMVRSGSHHIEFAGHLMLQVP